eukprot:TRINITY_DN25434_c0_g3_i2.p2 TRINITY_DN25434_c0_g3~~TRINITY_DN25434_c0_g3_i2.p2  ORF type:complete len:440 (+),score=75.19 TRINITY_DN25434_c0_g3_i2:91-1410(+)
MPRAGLRALLAAAAGADDGLREGGSATTEPRAELVRVTLAAELQLLHHSERAVRAELTAEEAQQWCAFVLAQCSVRGAAPCRQGAGQERRGGTARRMPLGRGRVEMRTAADGELLTRPEFLRRFGRYYEWNHAPSFRPPLRKPHMRIEPEEEARPAPEGPAPARARASSPAASRPPSGPDPGLHPPDRPAAACGGPAPQGPREDGAPPAAAEPPRGASAGQDEGTEPRRRPCLAATPVARTLEVRRGPDGRPKPLGMDIVETKGCAFVTGLAPGGAAECAGVPRQGLLVSIGGLRANVPEEVEQMEPALERLDFVEVLVRPLLHAPPCQPQPSRPVRGGRIASAGSSRSGSPAAHTPGTHTMRERLQQWLDDTPIGGNPASCSRRTYEVEPLLAFALKNNLDKEPPEVVYQRWVDCTAAEGEHEAAGSAGAPDDGYVIL